MKTCNKDLQQHIAKRTGGAGAHDRESRSNAHQKVKNVMRSYKKAYNTNSSIQYYDKEDKEV